MRSSLAFMCGGGMSNLLGRISQGYVVDMFDFRVFPVFNIADIFICAGCGLLIFKSVAVSRKRSETMCSEIQIKQITVNEEMEGRRLDQVLAAEFEDMSRSFIQKLFEAGKVTLNGKVCSKKEKAETGDEVSIEIPEPKKVEIKAENIPVDIVYEDDDVLVVDKPAGMVVHPARELCRNFGKCSYVCLRRKAFYDKRSGKTWDSPQDGQEYLGHCGSKMIRRTFLFRNSSKIILLPEDTKL